MLSGSINDYLIIGEIGKQALRQFQSSHRSSINPFKPLPGGFASSHAIRALPKGDA
jgi:hypothetical protein